MTVMDGAEFKRIREGLGLSLSDLATMLRVENIDNLRYFETGKKPVSGPISQLMDLLDQGYLDHLRPEQ